MNTLLSYLSVLFTSTAFYLLYKGLGEHLHAWCLALVPIWMLLWGLAKFIPRMGILREEPTLVGFGVTILGSLAGSAPLLSYCLSHDLNIPYFNYPPHSLDEVYLMWAQIVVHLITFDFPFLIPTLTNLEPNGALGLLHVWAIKVIAIGSFVFLFSQPVKVRILARNR